MYPYDPFQTQNPFLAQLQLPQTQPKVEIPYVNGKQSAESYQLAPNSSIVLLDSSAKRFYIKKTDASGAATVQSFDYMETAEEKPVEYVTREEFETFKAKMKGAKHEPSGDARKQSNSNVSNRSDDAR